MASSMQEYLKRYASDLEKPKKKKKKKLKALKGKGALTIIDGDPVWQKDIKEASSESEAEQGDAPMVIEDVEFKRMQRLEALRMRPYMATAADGSGWVSVNETLNQGSLEKREEHAQGVSPPRGGAQHDGVELTPERSTERETRKTRHDTPDRDLSPPRDDAQHVDEDLSPKRRERNSEKRRHDTPDRDLSPSRHQAPASKGGYDSPQSSTPRTGKNLDLSPPRRQTSSRTGRHDSPESSPPRTGKDVDLSPPRRRQTSVRLGRHDSPESSPPRRGKNADLSPPRRRQTSLRLGGHDSLESSTPRAEKDLDSSPPRRRQTSSRTGRDDSPQSSPSRAGNNLDLSPPRRRQTSTRTSRHDSSDSSPPSLAPRRRQTSSTGIVEDDQDDTDLSPKRRLNDDDSESRGRQKHKRKEIMADGTAAGLQSGRQLVKEMEKKKQNDSTRLKEVDMSISGRHANTVYRDKHGKRLEGVDEILKLQQAKEPKKEEKPLEWGRGLVQKREAEARYAELESEKEKPFARTRDDPDLEKALKERVRWGDPMAHLVKKKIDETVLLDLSTSELMKESGFIVPQAIPKHSWLKRGVAAPPNRYGIKPGRHWDGVDRSTGFEKDMYKRQNEKQAEQVEAYLWSVADM